MDRLAGVRYSPRYIVTHDHPVDMPSREQLHRLRHKAKQIGGDDHARAAVLELVQKLALSIERAQVDGVCAGPQDTEKADWMPGRVRYAWRHHCRGLFQMPIAA